MRKLIACAILLFACLPYNGRAFSLLSHEAIIDTTWKTTIRPLLKSRFPSATDDQLKDAYAYVYGGAVIPDIGYYPFGSLTFSHLVHYVRTGDFVSTLLSEAKDLNEFAFALGALCHYNADKYGHPLGTNRAVPLFFPEAAKKYGDTVTYDDDHKKHIRAEFGFDVLQTAKGNYAPKAYHDFIGFKISEPLLSRAFEKVYGLELKEVFGSLDAAVKSFRFAVKRLFPELTENAWKARKSYINKINPVAEKGSYHYKMKRQDYKKDFGAPALKSILFTSIIGIIPKYGPLSGLKFKEPTPEIEKLYDSSFNVIVQKYKDDLGDLHKKNATTLENVNYDTGKKTTRGEYTSADESYYELMTKLKRKKFALASSGLKRHLQAYYVQADQPDRYVRTWYKKKKIAQALDILKNT